MTSLVDRLPIVQQLSTVILPRESLPKNDEIIDDNDNSVNQLSDRYEESRLIHGNELLEKFVHQIEQVRRIYVYYATSDALQSDQIRISSGSEESEKLEFCLERDLEKQLQNAETGRAVDSSQSIDRSTIDNIATSTMERLSAKRTNNFDRHSPVPKRFAFTVQDNSFMKNINSRFFCPSCEVFLQEPYQLECGHRQCKSCTNNKKSCATCLKFISKDKIWFDRGFQNEIQQLSTTCLECEWNGSLELYQHLDQNHQQFINCSTCNKQVAQSSLHRHYLDEIHQEIHSALCLISPVNNSNINHSQIQGIISNLLNSTKVRNDEIQRINGQLNNHQHSISVMTQQWSSFKTIVQEINDHIYRIEINQNLLYQQFLLLKENVEDAQATSFDGTLTWKIMNFQEKRMDATSERNLSIYSPPFYSSQTDYKMRLQLFLNGNNNIRGTHMSLFLVLMQGNHDAILQWPFKFKVTFTVLNQLSLNNNHSISFWFDTTSSCFQHLTTDMNIIYGISRFLPLDLFEKNQNQYVQNDTMFFKVEIDFSAEKSENTIDSTGELLNDEGHADTIDSNLTL
ncbi:unnamed protein product [Rotaria sordida]|uniref:Uncharacterized protein n=1 Tax=Rotaria sordida TaxID=392033 RepID=A0A819MGR2_9BILA|nr:unnamed protein product [Rotaria sordida]